MKPRRLPVFATTRNFLLLPVITLALNGYSSADTFTWTNAAISTWSDTTKWTSLPVEATLPPNAAGSVVRYTASPNAGAAGTVTLDQAATIGIITQVANPSGGNNGVFKIEKSATISPTPALTFDNTSGPTNAWGNTEASIEFIGNNNTNNQLQINPDILITNTDFSISTILCGVQIGASANTSAITATTNQNLNLRANSATRALTINHSIGTTGTGTITLNHIGTGALPTTIAGNLGTKVTSITQNGANHLVLSGTNSDFVGPTTISAGALRYNSANALPPTTSGRSIMVNTGGIASAGYAIDDTILSRISLNSPGAIALHVTSANALDFTGFTDASLAATAAVTYNGALTPNSQAYRFGGGSAILTVNSALEDIDGPCSVTKVGPDTVVLSGNNTYTNGTTVSAGILQFPNPASLPEYTTAGKIAVASGAALGLAYGGTNDWQGEDLNDLLTNHASGFAPGSAIALNTSNGSLDFSFDITISNLGLTKLGNNVLTLSGNNTHTGVTTISGGTLAVETIGNGGVAGNLGQATNDAANIILNGGNINYIGETASTDRNFTLTTSGGGIEASGTGALIWNGTAAFTDTNASRTFTLGGSNTDNNTFASMIGNNGTGTTSLLKSGTGKWVLSNVNTYAGRTTISAGTLSIESGGSFTTTVSNNTSLVVGNTTGTALLHIQNGGTGTASRLQIGTASSASGAIYNQGSLTVIGSANISNFAVGYATGSYGYYRHDTANTTAANEMGIASSGNSTDGTGGNGVVDVLQGTLKSSQWFAMNRSNREQYSQLNISGGTFELPNNATQVGLFMNNNDLQNNKGGHAVINLSGTGRLTSAGTTTELDLMRITADKTTSTTMLGVLNIGSGGTVQTNRIKATQANGTAYVNFHGGTLKANKTEVTLLGGSNIDGVYIYSGGANIDTNNKVVTISEKLLTPIGSGVSSVPVTTNGTGYTGCPIVYLIGGDGTGATAVADFNPATGEVTGVTITNPGIGYTSAPSAVFSGGGGSEPILDTTTIAPNISGGLTKSGSGTLSLTAANDYTGDTTVTEGTLNLGDGTNNTSLADNSKVTITASATLNLNFLVGNTDTIKELWIAGEQLPIGVYGASDPSGQITGTGTLTVTSGPGGSTYETWATSPPYNLSGPNAAFDFDYDNDGIHNGLEWILGGNPTQNDHPSILPIVTGSATTGLTLVFNRAPDSLPPASSLVVDFDSDLDATWEKSVTIGTTNSGPDANGVTVAIDTPSVGKITVTIPDSNAQNGKLFSRLRAEKP